MAEYSGRVMILIEQFVYKVKHTNSHNRNTHTNAANILVSRYRSVIRYSIILIISLFVNIGGAIGSYFITEQPTMFVVTAIASICNSAAILYVIKMIEMHKVTHNLRMLYNRDVIKNS